MSIAYKINRPTNVLLLRSLPFQLIIVKANMPMVIQWQNPVLVTHFMTFCWRAPKDS